MYSPHFKVSEETLYHPSPSHHLPGDSWGLADVGVVVDGASKVPLDSGAGGLTGANWEVAWVWLCPGAGLFPDATGGGMSASLMVLPFCAETSRFSSV